MPRDTLSNEVVKRPHSKSDYTDQDLQDLALCVDDPLYFMRTFMRVQHPLRGAIPFIPYGFQERIVNGIHSHRFTIILTARQMGKCSTFDTIILKDQSKIKIGSLLRFSFKEKLICLLEKWLILLAKM